jgi:stage II sporulation protein D
MKWLFRFALLAAGALASCAAPPGRARLPSGTSAEAPSIRVGVREGNRITVRRVPLETYVRTTILSEFAPPGGDPGTVERMLEVQAVIGRTYALAHLGRHASEGFDVCTTTHCQLYQPSRLTSSRWAQQSTDAVGQTTGKILLFENAPALTLYHADCGGRTSRADDVWGGRGRPYLTSVVDDGPAEQAHAAWRYSVTANDMIAALNADGRTRVGGRLDGIQVLDRDAAGRAERVAIHGSQERIVRGEELREVLGQHLGARSIRSTWFTVQRTGGTFVFEGRGFGHGVGLCQAGALALIRAGATVAAVLERYFPGTTLKGTGYEGTGYRVPGTGFDLVHGSS